ncbi:cobalamin biosynthesis protein [Streptomyces sp. NPDC059740]|uniref:cobalamin biosynthesis protein n=1 Tax=Streptomyces sp. NPDC059740 TaxID=3346926 RepID=UPI003648C727
MLVVGLGARPGASAEEAEALAAEALREAARALGRPGGVGAGAAGGPLAAFAGQVALVATLARRAGEPAAIAVAARLGAGLRGWPAERLARVEVPHPAGRTRAAVGTRAVAEAAALLAAGPGARLLVPKRTLPLPGRTAMVTCAVACTAGAGRGPG